MQIAGVGAWRQIGLSLVELMISLALGSVILLVVFRVYFQVIENSRFDTEFTTIRHKSRMLFDVLSMYIQSSGAYGCKDTKLGLVIHQDSTKTAFNFETPIEGAEYASDVWVPALSVIPAEANTKSDVLVVRGPVDDFSFLTVGMSDATSAIAVGVGKPYKKEDVLVISDCMGAEIFSVGNEDVATSGVVSLTGSANNVTTQLTRAFGLNSELTPIGTSVFFVKDDPYGIPAFWVKVNDESPEIIARGVERFDVSYGVDTDDDGSVNAYLTAQQWNSLGTTSTLMSLRVAFLVRSINYLREARLGGPTIDFGSGVNKESIAPTPGRLRKAFDYTFVLKNPYTS